MPSAFPQGKRNGNKMINSLFHLFSQYNFQQISQYIFVERVFTKFFHFVYAHLGSKIRLCWPGVYRPITGSCKNTVTDVDRCYRDYRSSVDLGYCI